MWRLFSNFFYIGGPSMSFVMNLMFMWSLRFAMMRSMSFGSSFEKNPMSCTKGEGETRR